MRLHTALQDVNFYCKRREISVSPYPVFSLSIRKSY